MNGKNEFDEKLKNAVESWKAAKRRLELVKSEYNSAQCQMSNSQNALGKILVPDWQMREPYSWFNVWIEGDLLKCRKRKPGVGFLSDDYEIELIEVEKESNKVVGNEND